MIPPQPPQPVSRPMYRRSPFSPQFSGQSPFRQSGVSRGLLAAALLLLGSHLSASEPADPPTEDAVPKQSPSFDERADRVDALLEIASLKQALAEAEHAVRAWPDDPRTHALRAKVHLAAGDYAAGAADMKEAIARHPEDVGKDYQPADCGLHQGPLAPEELQHGREQLAKMLRDRPAMARYLREGDPLWTFAVRRFGGEALGEPIDWDPQPPTDAPAEHVAPHRGRRGRIRVTLLDPRWQREHPQWAFERLWSLAIFELHNMAVVPVFNEVRRQAAAGAISKREYVEGIFTAEHQAIERTRGFYAYIFLPYAAEHPQGKLETDPDHWFGSWWVDPAEVFGQFADRTEYPWRPYARMYDWHRVPVLRRQERYDEAIRLLRAMLGEEQYAHERPEVHYWLGICQLDAGDARAAIESLSEAIRLEPDHAGAYELRADAHQALGEADKAAADWRRAGQLGE